MDAVCLIPLSYRIKYNHLRDHTDDRLSTYNKTFTKNSCYLLPNIPGFIDSVATFKLRLHAITLTYIADTVFC